MTETTVNQRLVDLERQVAENQKTVDELNDLATRLWQEVDLLKADLKIIGRQVLDMTEGQAERPDTATKA